MKCKALWLPFNFLMLSLVLYHLMVPTDSCPAGCSREGAHLKCQSPTFPIYLPSRLIEYLAIRGNISRIPANAFVQPKETTLKTLRIHDSDISIIDSKAFNNLQVGFLSLVKTKIKHLSPRVFYNFKCDLGCFISQTEMDVFPTSLFEGLTTRGVFIKESNITTFQTDAFKSASNRTDGYTIGYNNINSVQKNAFPANVPLVIYGNKIKSFLAQNSVVIRSFHDNEFQCSCGLVWMWEDDSPFKEFLMNNKCIWPNGTTTYLHKIDKSTLCKDVDVTHASGIWEEPTTIPYQETTTVAATTTAAVTEATTTTTASQRGAGTDVICPNGTKTNLDKMDNSTLCEDVIYTAGQSGTEKLSYVLVIIVITCLVILF